MTKAPGGARKYFVAAVAGVVVAFAVGYVRRRRATRLRKGVQAVPPCVETDDGVLLHVEQRGSYRSGRPTVVLVHGLAADTRQWHPQLEHLQAHAQVLAYDQRGHGRSGWNGKDQADVERLGTDLAQVLGAYDLDHRSSPVIVVGHSLGGMAVLALARQRPDLFGNAVVAVGLMSTSSGGLETAVLPRRHSWAPHRLWQVVAELPWALAPLTQRLAPFRRRPVQRLLFRHLFGAGPVSADVKKLMRETWTGTPRAVTASFFPALLDYDTESALPSLAQVPTLVLAGSADATIPFAHSRRLAEQVDSAELVCVEGAGHMVGLTHADEVNKAIVELLRRARP